ncbi:MAG: phage tail protein, partial [Methylocella sp.]
MGFLRQHSNPGYIPKYSGLQIQTSSFAVPIPILYGTNRIAPNVIWTGGFYAIPQKQKGGGKGGGGQIQGYTYYTSFLLGVCEGPVVNYNSTYLNQQQFYGLAWTGLEEVTYGVTPQAPWGYLQARFPGQALGYNGTSYVGAFNFNLGSSPNLPQFSFEVAGISGIWYGNVVTIFDSDPALIIQDFLTNAQYGVLFPAASIDATTLLAKASTLLPVTVTISIASPGVVTWPAHGLSNGAVVLFGTTGSLPTGLSAYSVTRAFYYVVSATANTFEVALTPGGAPINTTGSQSGVQSSQASDSSYQAYCRAVGLALSPSLTNQEAANSILARWLKLTNTAAVWSGGKLKFIPYGDSVAINPGTTIGAIVFNPNLTPLYNLADDDFIHEDGKDPIEAVRSDPYSVSNWQRLQINCRNFIVNYNVVPIDTWDQNAIELYGLRRASDITASEICDYFVGQRSVQLILQRGLSIRNTYLFKLSFEYCLLEPMDLVTVTDTALGLIGVAVRITSIEEDDAGLLAVTAEEFPGGTATAVQYPVSQPAPNSTNQNVVPARVNAPVILEPPSVLSGGVAEVWAAVSGGVASAYLLAETAGGTAHSTQQTVVSSQPVNIPGGSTPNVVAFSVYAQASGTGANLRSAIRLTIFNGSATIGAHFNLTGAGTL